MKTVCQFCNSHLTYYSTIEFEHKLITFGDKERVAIEQPWHNSMLLSEKIICDNCKAEYEYTAWEGG